MPQYFDWANYPNGEDDERDRDGTPMNGGVKSIPRGNPDESICEGQPCPVCHGSKQPTTQHIDGDPNRIGFDECEMCGGTGVC